MLPLEWNDIPRLASRRWGNNVTVDAEFDCPCEQNNFPRLENHFQSTAIQGSLHLPRANTGSEYVKSYFVSEVSAGLTRGKLIRNLPLMEF